MFIRTEILAFLETRSNNMQKNNSKSLTQFYDQLVTEFNEDTGVMWCYMNPYPRPCFTSQLLQCCISPA